MLYRVCTTTAVTLPYVRLAIIPVLPHSALTKLHVLNRLVGLDVIIFEKVVEYFFKNWWVQGASNLTQAAY